MIIIFFSTHMFHCIFEYVLHRGKMARDGITARRGYRSQKNRSAHPRNLGGTTDKQEESMKE